MNAIPILFTSWYVGLGGGETDLISLLEQLDTQHYTPHLLVPYTGQLSDYWTKQGWHVHQTAFRGATTWFIPKIWEQFPVVKRIEAILQEQRIRAIHCDYHTLPLVLPAAKKLNIPVMWTCWGWWFKPKFWQKDFFRSVDYICARSQAIKDGFLGDPPFIPSKNIPLVYSGVDIDRFHPHIIDTDIRQTLGITSEVPLVAMIARFQNVKGHHIFQEMVRKVVATVPESQFIVAGEDVHNVSSDAAYKTQILENHHNDPILRDHVTYLGFRDDPENVMAAADVVVCPSEFESYGRVNVEAMAVGKPVVSTNQGGPSETILHNETGFLVPPRDADGLARYVIQLLQDASLREKMGIASRKRIETVFSAHATAQPYIEQLEKWTS